ncbi:hypothetical protein OROMI_013263 [Orobanche minor]
MASSQTSSHSQKRDQIIDGRLFSRTTVMFYRDAFVKSHSRKHGGGIISISATVQGIAICINQELLVTMFGLPSDGVTMEELESFDSDELLTAYWGLFTGKSSNKDVHPSCPKKKFCLPFVFLHDFCCRIIENRIGAFDTCTNLRFRMMIAILYGEKVNWSQIVLKRLSEEVSKPQSQKKSFGLLLNNILMRSGVQQSKHAKKIGSGKFIGGYKPSAYHQAGPTANRPFLNLMPSAKNPRGTSKKTSFAEDESSKKIKRSLSDSNSPLTEKKKHKKASKSKARGTMTDPVTITDVPVAQPADHQTQGETPAVESISPPVDPKPTTSNDQILAGLENLNESTAHMKSFVSSPVRSPIPEQDPTHYRVPSPSRDSTPNRVPTPVRDSSLIQDPTPVEDPVPTVNPIPVRSPSPSAKSLSDQVEQAFTRFIKWKSYRTAPYDVLSNWKEWREEEQFILDVTDSKEILLLILMENDQCKELISGHYLDLNHSVSFHPVQPDNPCPCCCIRGSIPREDQVSLPEQSEAERQQEPAPTPVPLSSEPEPSHIASSSFRCPESPRTEARKEQLNALGRQSLFIQYAVEALYQVGKEMDWLNLTASEEMESVNVELTKIAEAFSTLPQDLKEAFAKFQYLEEQSLLEKQSKLCTVESRTVAILEYTDSKISDHDAKISEMANVIYSFDEKLAKFEEQQDNFLKVLRSIDHTVSELNARKGEGQSDSSREPAHSRPDQARRLEHESTRSSSSRPEHQHRIWEFIFPVLYFIFLDFCCIFTTGINKKETVLKDYSS